MLTSCQAYNDVNRVTQFYQLLPLHTHIIFKQNLLQTYICIFPKRIMFIRFRKQFLIEESFACTVIKKVNALDDTK